jgi:hypothetical protein
VGHSLDPVLAPVAARILSDPTDRARFDRSCIQYDQAGVGDFAFASAAGIADPAAVFERLRWGGQFIFASRRRRETDAVLARFARAGEFLIETPPQSLTRPRWGIPFLSPLLPPLRTHYFVARKVRLTPADEDTDRYSYDVQLAPAPGHGGPGPTACAPQPVTGTAQSYVVVKQVPTFEGACQRLSRRFGQVPPAVIEKAARKLVNKVFPLFLSREAALLMILHRKLGPTHRDRFPTVLDIVKDQRGLVQRLTLNWLRQGGPTMAHLEFARQSLELLHVLQEQAGIIHLDLRLDNFIITERGVGFVDFGSAVRVGEDFSDNPLLTNLFGEMLAESQIQRDLRRMLRRGTVTSSLFSNCYCKIDKAVDLFYVVLQMTRPHANPDFRGLVSYDPQSPTARHLRRLSAAVLRPSHPTRPRYATAAAVLAAVERLAGHV